MAKAHSPIQAVPTSAPTVRVGAGDFLAQAAATIQQRGRTRDTAAAEASAAPQERSMASTVAAFNAIHGTELTERQGWMFMVMLKAARAHASAVNGQHNPDDYLDGAAYNALAGESVAFPAPRS